MSWKNKEINAVVILHVGGQRWRTWLVYKWPSRASGYWKPMCTSAALGWHVTGNASIVTITTRACRVLTRIISFWCDFDRASSLMCGTKMPTRCNRGFYRRSYCLLNMFRAPLCPSSGAQEYYTVVAACGIWCCGFQVAGLVCSWRLCVRFAGCCSILQTGHITLTHNTNP